MQRVERMLRPRTAAGGVIETYGHSRYGKSKRKVRSAKSERIQPTHLRQTPVIKLFGLKKKSNHLCLHCRKRRLNISKHAFYWKKKQQTNSKPIKTTTK